MRTAYLFAVTVALLAGRANAADAPSYVKEIKPFLANYCADCHGATIAKKGVNVESMAAMLKARGGSFLIPGSPEKSRLIAVMTGAGKQMPPRKYAQQPTKEEIAKVKAWITAGAKDDSDKATPEKKGDGESEEEAAASARDEKPVVIHGFSD